MIYNENKEYKVKFYKDIKSGRDPVTEYVRKLKVKERTKVFKYIEFLRVNKGYLDEPYSRHIKGKIRELMVDFARNRHRIFYFTFIKRTIILLHIFLKKGRKTPGPEIRKAEERYYNVLVNKEIYE